MFDLMRVYRYKSSGKPGRAERAFSEHREIFSAIQRRDADEAQARMSRHIRQARMNLLRQEGLADAAALGTVQS
jgi:DNA-binding GntR family transcriptional regulator